MEDDLDVLVSALTSVDFKESQVQILRESDEPYSSGAELSESHEVYSVH